MKRLLKCVALICLALFTLAGCGKKTVSGDNADYTVRVGALKGPTAIGLVNLMKDNEDGVSKNKYEFTIEAQADVLMASVLQGNTDIALVPANAASVLYNKTEGAISVIDINTLGVLYFISADESVSSVKDLSGKTVYMTGKGTTPEIVINYLLDANSVSDVDVQYFSEATEVLNALMNNSEAVALLPQPFATAAILQNDDLKIVIDSNESFKAAEGTDGNGIVTGVTIVRNDFLKEHPEAVNTFMEEHKTSAMKAESDQDVTAGLIVSYGIIEKEPVAKKALPYCNITYIDGQDMKNTLSVYLNIVSEKDASFVGGNVPADNFYYIK